jgi:hypothetical protein
MNELYELHLQKLEGFMNKVRMTPQQRMELYSIAESFLADGSFPYATAFANNWKWPPVIETRLNTASNEVIAFSRELIKRQDEVAASMRKAETSDSNAPLEVVVSDKMTKSE